MVVGWEEAWGARLLAVVVAEVRGLEVGMEGAVARELQAENNSSEGKRICEAWLQQGHLGAAEPDESPCGARIPCMEAH